MIWLLLGQYREKLGNLLFYYLVSLVAASKNKFEWKVVSEISKFCVRKKFFDFWQFFLIEKTTSSQRWSFTTKAISMGSNSNSLQEMKEWESEFERERKEDMCQREREGAYHKNGIYFEKCDDGRNRWQLSLPLPLPQSLLLMLLLLLRMMLLKKNFLCG